MKKGALIIFCFVILVSFASAGWFSDAWNKITGNVITGNVIADDCNNVVALYHLDGDAVDSSGNGNDGSVNGAVSTEGKIGSALSVDSFSNVTIPSSASLESAGSFSVSFWVNGSNLPGSNEEVILSKGPNYIFNWGHSSSEWKQSFSVWRVDWGDLCKANIATPLSANTWYHIVGVFDNSENTIKFYLNGALEDSQPCTLIPWVTEKSLNIGNLNNPFDGSIDELIIYDRALSQNEITQLYNFGTGVNVSCGGGFIPSQICNNGSIEGTEVCEAGNLNGESCVSQGFDSGTLNCASNCLSFDTSSCVSASSCTDSDGDGYGIGSDLSGCSGSTTLADCDDSDSLINPGATEICGDGVDNNCTNGIDEGCGACSYVPRNYYGARLEPVDYVLHGAGQSTWDTGILDYIDTLPPGYGPAYVSDYCRLYWSNTEIDTFVLKIENWLTNFPDYTALQLGLSMHDSGAVITQEIINGDYDSNLNYLFTKLDSLNIPIYFRIGFEFNGNWNDYSNKGDYKLAFQHITNILRNSSLGDNSATAWCFAPDGSSSYMDWYPGDAYVDWWSIDVFNDYHLTKSSTINFLADANSHQKPILIGEAAPRYTGVLNGQQSWDDWFDPYFQWIRDNPGIKAFIHINWNWNQYAEFSNWGESRIGQNSVVNTLYTQEMTCPLYFHASTKQAFLDALNQSTPQNPQCSDGIDNDKDGYCDTAGALCTDGSTPGDPDCSSATDDNETGVVIPPKLHPADLDDDGCIDQLEISKYIGKWFAGISGVTIESVGKEIEFWQAGCGSSCTPTTCSALGYDCGSWSDGCNGTLDCGVCNSGLSCVDGQCVNQSSGSNILSYSDLQYKGAFRPPKYSSPADRFGYGMKSCSYVQNCFGNDPSPNDGYPGCLICTSKGDDKTVGAFDIKPPQIVSISNRNSNYYLNNLPAGQEVLPMFDCSDGIADQYGGTSMQWEIPGVVILPNGLGVCTCVHDWYNTGTNDNPSHCWFDPNPQNINAQGPYNFGPSGDSVFHANKMSAYLGLIPQSFADNYLGANGKQYCFTGFNHGGKGGTERSIGPALYSFECGSRPSVAPQSNLSATALLYYLQPSFPYKNANHPYLPNQSVGDWCHDATWINYGGKKGVVFACIKGGPIWWYGGEDPYTSASAHRNQCKFNAGTPIWGSQGQNPGADCSTEFFDWGPVIPQGFKDNCASGKGYHGVFATNPQYKARLLFYDEKDLADVAIGLKKPTEITYTLIVDQPSELWDLGECRYSYGGIAFDEVNGLLYVTQRDLKENPVIHVYQIN